MNHKFREFLVTANRDEVGELEVFGWDLSPTVSAEETLHLDENGLPKLGCILTPGMIVVGKIAKTKKLLAERPPTSLELNALTFKELNERFGHLWKNTSEYVPEGVRGVVEFAQIVTEGNSKKAIVRIRCID